ncbi:MAG: hypothetical protein M1836_003677 [Candelina mexicana]|nr:MAG: hypothetical protein M1836_003677 [Candelina mexicana]
MFFSLAADLEDDAVVAASPAMINNLSNLRDHDVGLLGSATVFLGRGATFSVRKTRFPDSANVVLKSGVFFEAQKPETQSFMRLVNNIMLELRVLTHRPLRVHPNIVKLLQVSWEADPFIQNLKWPVLITELADLGTLQDFLENFKPLGWDLRISLTRDIVGGLAALHDNGVVHGDLKLSNVLVFSSPNMSTPRAKLSDFGGALLDNPDELTCPMCTPPWTAPEYDMFRTRAQLMKSDVYTLGLLLWQILLNESDPFQQIGAYDPELPREQQLSQIQLEKRSDNFFQRVSENLGACLEAAQFPLMRRVLKCCLQLAPENRDLEYVIDQLSIRRNPGVDESSESLQTRDESDDRDRETGMSETDVSYADDLALNKSRLSSEPGLSLGGLDFYGVTNSLSGEIVRAFEETANQDLNPVFKLEAIYVLVTIYLGYYDFGLVENREQALQSVLRSAYAGNTEHQAIVLRVHHAFGLDLPLGLLEFVKTWLLNTGATGSLTAMEDMAEFGFTSELSTASAALRTRYCGIGYEIFDYDEEAFQAIVNGTEDECKRYILDEINQAETPNSNLKEYHLRLVAAYGRVAPIDYLVSEHHAMINDKGAQGDTAILFAARSGHKAAILRLLELGADPRIPSYTGETALHWLCSFDDQDIEEVTMALLSRGADLEAQAEQFPPGDNRLNYSETEFVPGTPLHRAICRNKLQQTELLLRLGANVHAVSNEDADMSPLVLAVLLHYPDCVRACLLAPSLRVDQLLILPSGRSILTVALAGGSLHRLSIGRIIRHGNKREQRATETLDILLGTGISGHFHDLPGEQGRSTLQFAVRHPLVVVEWLLRHGCRCDLNRPYMGQDDATFVPHAVPYNEGSAATPNIEFRQAGRPPLFEAIHFNRPEMVQLLLDNNAEPIAHQGQPEETTALYHAAYACFENLQVLRRIHCLGVPIDQRYQYQETAFQCAVRNGCFTLASFLRDNGADVNILANCGMMWSCRLPVTLLGQTAVQNSSSSISRLIFLLDDGAPGDRVGVYVVPSLSHTVFHEMASLNGDSLDGLTISRALTICSEYFRPSSAIWNARSLPNYIEGSRDNSIEGCGGNTALHYAVMHANYETVWFILKECKGVDTTIQNDEGYSALDIAQIVVDGFEDAFVLRDVPMPRTKQHAIAESRRRNILRLLKE